MRVVLDTNVPISGLLRPHSTSAVLLRLMVNGDMVPLIDERILQEYEEVATRPKFGILREDLALVLAQIRARGERIVAQPLSTPVPDVDDLPFLEVARSGRADVLITGNKRHFPPAHRGEVEVLNPKEALEKLAQE